METSESRFAAAQPGNETRWRTPATKKMPMMIPATTATVCGLIRTASAVTGPRRVTSVVGADPLLKRRENVVGDVEVGEHGLHIVQILESIDEPQHLRS